MKFTELQDSVEKNIIKTFKTFYENPAIFLTEADVQCYLYSLLINDPFLKKFFASFNYLTTKKEISNTILIHSELAVSMSSSKRKRYDISIWKPRKNIDFSEWETLVGIEIKYNRRLPARSEASGIIKDIRSVRYNKQGYVLWLNWDREIDDNHLKVAQKLANKYENVKLFFLDLYSEPIKTNIDEILEMNTIEEKE